MPEIESDDNKSMLFSTLVGEEETTCTHIRIDGKENIYGKGFLKEIVNGVKKNDTIETSLIYDNVVITQLLSIVKGQTTDNYDTLKIEYQIENIDNQPHTIELKLILDTFLGNNDGAPFSVPTKGVVMTDTLFESTQLPEFWYVIDNIKEPSICGIGVLKVAGYTPPTKVIFTGWPNLYYSKTWIPELKEGRKFKSSMMITGTDSACGIYWGPHKVLPGEKLKYSFLYGVYGIAVKTGEIIDLAIATLKKVKEGDNFILTCDVQNKTNYIMDFLEVSLILPEEIKVLDEKKEPIKRVFEKISPADIIKLSWELHAGKKSSDILKKSKIIITAKGQITTPTDKVQKSITAEREVVVLPVLSLEQINKDIEFLTQQIKQVNNKIVEINHKLSRVK